MIFVGSQHMLPRYMRSPFFTLAAASSAEISLEAYFCFQLSIPSLRLSRFPHVYACPRRIRDCFAKVNAFPCQSDGRAFAMTYTGCQKSCPFDSSWVSGGPPSPRATQGRRIFVQGTLRHLSNARTIRSELLATAIQREDTVYVLTRA